jgi:hypothetical protein
MSASKSHPAYANWGIPVPASMDFDEEWEAAEGIPRLEDPFIQQYLNGRDALVAQEKQKRSGW